MTRLAYVALATLCGVGTILWEMNFIAGHVPAWGAYPMIVICMFGFADFLSRAATWTPPPIQPDNPDAQAYDERADEEDEP